MHKKAKKIRLAGCVCGPMRRGQRAWWCMVYGVWCSIGQALASSCFTTSALRSGKRARLLAALVTVRQARSVLGVCKPGRCRARSGCAFGCWLRPFGSGLPVTRSAQIRTSRKVFGRRLASFGGGGLIFGTIVPPPGYFCILYPMGGRRGVIFHTGLKI